MVRLPVPLAERRAAIVWIRHTAQYVVGCSAVLHHVFSDVPVVAVDHYAEHVGERFIQGAAFILVFQVGGFFHYAVRHFMTAHVESACQFFENAAAVAVPHGGAVPVGIFHGRAVAFRHVDKGDDVAARAVDGVAVEGIFEIIVTLDAVPVAADGRCIIERGGVGRDQGVVESRLIFRGSIERIYRDKRANRVVWHGGGAVVEHKFARVFQHDLAARLPGAETAADAQQVGTGGSNRAIHQRTVFRLCTDAFRLRTDNFALRTFHFGLPMPMPCHIAGIVEMVYDLTRRSIYEIHLARHEVGVCHNVPCQTFRIEFAACMIHD